MSLIFNKKYKLHASENVEEFLKALGVSLEDRNLCHSAIPVVELTKKEDGKLVLSSTSDKKDFSIEFYLNEEFVEETLYDHKVTSLFTQDGNKLVVVQKSDNYNDVTIVREFNPDELKITLTIDGITCYRIYKPVD
ncbi:PREDICTED: fatty acid-binding protein, muscle-like [Diuraphis noxia]|uniref:fatty acid-binding protein, muscle-like n=1 Tax=Diuraphis noxia TaxID=143948 RepID=UPI00076365B4|nr:PREDICTED: fatty acid-binding protein, muscle-like [Diuraphis noxia]